MDLGTSLSVFGRLYGAFSDLQVGSDAKKAAEFQAAQLRQNAGQAQASAQRDAYSVQQQADLVASRALAVAAASGGGASDPTVVNIMAGIAAEGSYRTAVSLYQGEEKARQLMNQAEVTEYEGKLAQRAGVRRAIGKTFGAASAYEKGKALAASKGIAQGQSLYEKYGMGGPGDE